MKLVQDAGLETIQRGLNEFARKLNSADASDVTIDASEALASSISLVYNQLSEAMPHIPAERIPRITASLLWAFIVEQNMMEEEVH